MRRIGVCWAGCNFEDDAITEQKVHQRADGDGDEVRRNVVEFELPNEEAHQEEIPHNGDGAVAGVELHES